MSTSLPQKRYEYTGHHILDGSRWADFQPRDGDIVISTSYKAGTTWMQAIVANLLFQDGEMPEPVSLMSPWLDNRRRPLGELLSRLEELAHRRFIKTHLPLDGLPYFSQVKYIVVGRDPRDVYMSLRNHHANYTEDALALWQSADEEVGRHFPADLGSVSEGWRNWLTRGCFPWEGDGYPYWSHLHHCASWWEYRELPNVFLTHYADLLADPEGEIRNIADFLDIAIEPDRMPGILDRVSFATMKRDFNRHINPNSPHMFKGGGESFMNKGVNGRWRDQLDEQDLKLYDDAMARVLTPEASRWLESGGR